MKARYIFLTKGVGRHKEKLFSFEEALRVARIANFNLVSVSSIYPPGCKMITAERGANMLEAGSVVYTVMSRVETNENRRLIASSIGVARPKDRKKFGYLSEHHSFGETDDEAGDYAEDLAASMLATVLGVAFDPDASWDKKKEVWKISREIVRTQNIAQSAMGKRGLWTTAITAAVLVP